MEFNFPPFSIIFFIGTALALAFAIAVYARRPAPGARLFVAFASVCALWAFCGGLETGAVKYSTEIFWIKVEYFGVVSSGAIWLSFALDYSGSKWWRKPRNLFLLWTIPVVTIILALTNDWHHLFWSQVNIPQLNDNNLLIYSHGPWFWVFIAYDYIVFLSGVALLIRFLLHKSGSYRWQIITLLIGTLIPIAGSVVYVSNSSPMKGLDVIPFTFVVAGAVYALTIFRFRFPDILPIARNNLITNMPDGILVVDADGEIVDINPAMGKIKGINIKQALGKKLADVWPELDSISNGVKSEKYAEMIMGDSEANLFFDVSVIPLGKNRRTVSGQLIVLRNITERKLTDLRLKSLLNEEQKLRQSLQDEIDKRTQYTRTLVHELRTPLTAILASSELLESEVKGNLPMAMVKNIRQSSVNLELRINELVEMARGELGMLKISPAPLNLRELLLRIVSEMSPIATSKGLLLAYEIPELSLVMGDQERLRQIITNLVSNALKFTQKGIISITAGEYDSDAILVQVKDTGKGLEKDEIEFIFDPYRRKIRDNQDSGGLGIGLALSKMLVDLHHGKIWVESVPGTGSTFNFTIPKYQEK